MYCHCTVLDCHISNSIFDWHSEAWHGLNQVASGHKNTKRKTHWIIHMFVCMYVCVGACIFIHEKLCSMMRANNETHYSLKAIIYCLHITLFHYHNYGDISEGIERFKIQDFSWHNWSAGQFHQQTRQHTKHKHKNAQKHIKWQKHMYKY